MAEHDDALSDATKQVLESATRLLAEAGDTGVVDEFVAEDTGLPVGVVRDSVLVLGDRYLEILPREDGSITIVATAGA